MNSYKRSKYTYSDYPRSFTGIAIEQMEPYRFFINKTGPGICGTYVCASLVHYIYKHEQGIDLGMQNLIDALSSRIDGRLPYAGTYAWDLVLGLNELLADVSDYQAQMRFFSEPAVLDQLQAPTPRPVIVGSLKRLGSRYGNHWLLAYAYGYNSQGKLFYRVYDNHGSVRQMIVASQTLPAVYITKKG